MSGYFKPVCRKELFSQPGINKIINEKQYKQTAWGIFKLVGQYGTDKIIEQSYYYKIGEPIQSLRPNSLWDSYDDFLENLHAFVLDTAEQIKLEERTEDQLIVPVEEPYFCRRAVGYGLTHIISRNSFIFR